MVCKSAARVDVSCNPRRHGIASKTICVANQLAPPVIHTPHWLIFVALRYLVRVVFSEASPMQQDEATFVLEFVLCARTFLFAERFLYRLFYNDVVDWTFQ